MKKAARMFGTKKRSRIDVLLTSVAGLALASGMAMWSSSAAAQDPGSMTVRERQAAQTTGVTAPRLGGFIINPALEITEKYDDNIFANPNGEEGDFITLLTPSLSVTSDMSRHEFGFDASATIGRYADNDAEDFEDWSIGGHGRIDVRRDTTVNLNASFANNHEERGSANAAAGKSPTEFNTLNAAVQIEHDFNRVRLDVEGTFDGFNFDNVTASGGAVINNNDRDRNELGVRARTTYDVRPGLGAFIEGEYTNVNYDSPLDDAGFNRDSSGFSINTGAEIQLTGLVVGEVSVGYVARNFDDSALPRISGVNYGAQLQWNVTPITTMTFTASHDIIETTVAGAAGSFDNSVGVAVDHELTRDVVVGASVSFVRGNFQGTARQDDTISAGLSVDYQVNRFFFLGANYDYTNRDSSGNPGGVNPDFARNAVALTGRVSF